jgi:O-antigen biosynthesis protein
LKGFDPDFHMYGEDIDLCYRAHQAGWKTTYFHETTIIHYQGKSTKRSSMNEVKVFYQAMEIFAQKHYGSSFWFLYLLKIGIKARALIAALQKNSRSVVALLWDCFAVNVSILAATPYRFHTIFGLPDYAYPTVFIVASAVVLLSHFFSGTYFEGKSLVRRVVLGYSISFFLLSSLTYFFNSYGFSRGVLLLSILFALMISILGRSIIAVYEKLQGSESEKHIAVLGTNDHAGVIINTLLAHESQRANVVGVIAPDNYYEETFAGLPVLGKMSYIRKVVDEHLLDEIIVTDNTIDSATIIQTAMQLSADDVRLHIADDYDGVITARIVNSILGIESTVPLYKAHLLRYRVVKRLFDIMISTLWEVLGGTKSIVGIYSRNGAYPSIVKTGITGLAQLSRPELLSDNALHHLNTYYIQNYSPALDIEILLRFFFRRKRGN